MDLITNFGKLSSIVTISISHQVEYENALIFLREKSIHTHRFSKYHTF